MLVFTHTWKSQELKKTTCGFFHSTSDLSSMYGHLNKTYYPVCNNKHVLDWVHSLGSFFFLPVHLKENISHYLKEKPVHRNNFPSSHINFRSYASLCLAAHHPSFVPGILHSIKQFKSGVRGMEAPLLLCQADNPLMASQQFHPPKSGWPSEAEVLWVCAKHP